MPDQNNPLSPQTAQPTNSAPVSSSIEEVTVPFMGGDPSQNVSVGNTPSPSTPEASSPTDMPSIIASPKSKKFGGKKIIATILGLFLLVGGLAAGTILVRQRQDIREKAQTGGSPITSSDCQVAPGQTSCQTTVTWDFTACYDCNYGMFAEAFNDLGQRLDRWSIGGWSHPVPPEGDKHVTGSASFTMECGKNYLYLLWNHDACEYKHSVRACVPNNVCEHTGSDFITGCSAGEVGGFKATGCSQLSAQCLNVKVWKGTQLLTSEQIRALKAGEKIGFSVSGTATSGTFDKARFTVNGVLRPEVTTVWPGTTEFYDPDYTIPAGTLNFTVKGELHHSTLGWF